MTVKMCKNCGQPLYRNPSKCRWCQTPVRKITALHYSIFMVLVVGYLFMAPFPSIESTGISKAQKQIHTPQVKTITTPIPKKQIRARSVNTVKSQPPINVVKKSSDKVKIKKQVVSSRQRTPVKSLIAKKLKQEQPLTLVGLGNRGQVLQVKKESKQDRLQISRVAKLPPPTPSKTMTPQKKAMTPQQAYRAFKKYFKQFNAEIKTQKGMAFFEHVEYLDQGVIQVTATGIFLSAPEIYRQNYLRKIAQKWVDFREPGQPTVVRIVDAEGILRMENKRG